MDKVQGLLIKFIKKIFSKKPGDKRIGQSWITEQLPKFHDRAKTTNKTIWIIKKMITDDVAEVYHFGFPSFPKHVDISNKKMLTQQGVPIRFNTKGKFISHDPLFEKEGYQEGQIYAFERLGFLGDFDSIKKVFCVTDQYVMFKRLDSDTIFENTYKELSILCPTRK